MVNAKKEEGNMEHIRPAILAMKAYTPGFQPGPHAQYIKLNSNENPFPPSPRVRDTLAKLNYEDLRLYPDPMSYELRQKLAALYGFSPEEIICGNGSDEILNIIVRTFVQPGEAISFHEPTFPLYRILGTIQGSKVIAIPMSEPYENPPFPSKDAKVFFLANPNSPIGFAIPSERLIQLAQKTQGILVVDEAYAEFARENALGLIRRFENLIVVRTVSKSYSLAGVRLGYAIGPRHLISAMLKVKDPFNINRLTQSIVVAAFEDQEYMQKAIKEIVTVRDWFTLEIQALGYRVIPSHGNFIFPKPPVKGRGIMFYEKLLERRVLTRHYPGNGLEDGVRMTIGTRKEMTDVLQVMKDILPEFNR